ncbi:MAG TPA: hypothetical protein VFW77_03730 [Candidatus Saccharimonadales bacterium]|nr:hypothetical protein [Candidatus Saccharimonadales bacterium]
MPAIMEKMGELAPMPANGAELQAHLYANPVRGRGQKKRVYFTPSGETPVTDGSRPDEVTKVSYLVLDGDKALFLGMALNKALRGAGLGRNMLRYFADHVEGEGLDIVGTARINKPMIALTLQREGYEVASDACTAEILPTEGGSLVPTVRFLNNTLPESEIKDGFWGGNFYHVAESGLVEDRPVDTDKVVGLHLPYTPPLQTV